MSAECPLPFCHPVRWKVDLTGGEHKNSLRPSDFMSLMDAVLQIHLVFTFWQICSVKIHRKHPFETSLVVRRIAAEPQNQTVMTAPQCFASTAGVRNLVSDNIDNINGCFMFLSFRIEKCTPDTPDMGHITSGPSKCKNHSKLFGCPHRIFIMDSCGCSMVRT